MDIKDHIRSIPDFPKPGIQFYDISTLLAHPDAWQVAMGRLAQMIRRYQPDVLAGIESRGFLVAAPLAREILETIATAGRFDEEPGSGIAFQVSIEDAVGLSTQEGTILQEIEDSI